MRYAHIYSRLLKTPWFLDEGTLTAIMSLLESRINGSIGGSLRRARAELPLPDGEEDDPLPAPPTVDGVAVIPVFGVLGKHLSEMETMCGGCDMDSIRRKFDAAMADPAIKSVVLYFDSPGGSAIGCHELFTHLFESKSKPLYAFTDTLCGSAAYYLACAADAIFTAPTAQVGSIGCMFMVCDASEAYAKQGVKFKLLKSGEWKGLGDPRVPLSKEGEGILQDIVSQLGGQFRADVSRARPSIAKSDMEGLAYLGTDAVNRKLADAVVLDLPTLLARLIRAT